MNLNWAPKKCAANSKIWLLPIRPSKVTLNLGNETKNFLFGWRPVSTFQTAITDCIYKRTGFFPRRHSTKAKITLMSLRNQRAHSATVVTTFPRSATKDIEEWALQTQIAKVSMLNNHYCTDNAKYVFVAIHEESLRAPNKFKNFLKKAVLTQFLKYVPS